LRRVPEKHQGEHHGQRLPVCDEDASGERLLRQSCSPRKHDLRSALLLVSVLSLSALQDVDTAEWTPRNIDVLLSEGRRLAGLWRALMRDSVAAYTWREQFGDAQSHLD
jgi:hypothetical protein